MEVLMLIRTCLGSVKDGVEVNSSLVKLVLKARLEEYSYNHVGEMTDAASVAGDIRRNIDAWIAEAIQLSSRSS